VLTRQQLQVRACRVARTIAAALQVPVSWLTVTDDPRREHPGARRDSAR
jgi:hypothetical protein